MVRQLQTELLFNTDDNFQTLELYFAKSYRRMNLIHGVIPFKYNRDK